MSSNYFNQFIWFDDLEVFAKSLLIDQIQPKFADDIIIVRREV